MLPDKYHLTICPENEHRFLADDLSDFLFAFAELTKKDNDLFVNSDSFPFIEIKLERANHFRIHQLKIICSKNDEDFLNAKALCIRIAYFLKWRLVEEGENKVLWTPLLKMFYKSIGADTQYWSVRNNEDDTTSIVSGKAGQHGLVELIGPSSEIADNIEGVIHQICKEGFDEYDESSGMAQLEILYEDSETHEAFMKRREVESRIKELLWQTGLGFCIGRSDGLESFSVDCNVIDFNLAKDAIAEDLKDSEFANYIEIVLFES